MLVSYHLPSTSNESGKTKCNIVALGQHREDKAIVFLMNCIYLPTMYTLESYYGIRVAQRLR